MVNKDIIIINDLDENNLSTGADDGLWMWNCG